MALSNQRFVTTWTSEDSVQWRMYIIPSSVNYINPGVSSDVTLPAEFLLRDMALDTELGSIPAGLVSQVLKINVNIAALQGTTALNDLRTDLLRGTTAKRVPLLVNGAEFASGFISLQERQFDAFNTFVLQYNDGSGWKVAFIGCQKYSAENEIEITPLDNVIKFSIEIFDIHRCIGEMITPEIWKLGLRATGETVNFSSTIALPESTEFNDLYIGSYNRGVSSTTFAIDSLPGNYTMYLSTFKRLSTKIGLLYSCYLRAITQRLTASFVCHDIFTHSAQFSQQTDSFGTIDPQYLCFISEIYNDKLELISGAIGDATMFAQFTNFHEVYRMLAENAVETVRPTYTFTSATPDVYTVTMVSSNPYPASSQVTFDEDNTYGNLKIKMFSETLNQVNVAVSSIRGDKDTESYEYGKQGTSGDNSKDMKIMFHNTPTLTHRSFRDGDNINIDAQSIQVWRRNTINPGYILYLSNPTSDQEKVLPQAKRPTGNLSIIFGGESYTTNFTQSLNDIDNPALQLIKEQQFTTLPTTIANAMVNFLGRPKQAEATLGTTFTTAKSNNVGQRCTVNLSDYNTLLQSIYGASTALAVMTKHSHKIYEGMCDLTLRIDAESV